MIQRHGFSLWRLWTLMLLLLLLVLCYGKEEDNNNNNNDRSAQMIRRDKNTDDHLLIRMSKNQVRSSHVDAFPISDTYNQLRKKVYQQPVEQQDLLDESNNNDSNNNNNDNNNELSVVIHIGPMKTGSSSIQSSMFHIFTKKVPGGTDNYEDAGISMDYGTETYNFISCFKPYKNNTGESFMICKPETLQMIPKVAERKHNLIISAEYLTSPETEIQQIKEFIQPYWTKQYVVAFYRRYYDWLVSFHNQGNKKKPTPERQSIVEFLSNEAKKGHFWWRTMYIVDAIERWKVYFNNIRIINMYEQEDGDVREQFYCDGIPNAPTACSRIRQMKRHEQDNPETTKEKNPSIPFIYEDLAYYGIQSLPSRKRTILTIPDVALQIKHYQETVLNRTMYEFIPDAISCPPDDILEYLLSKSIETEQQLFPEYYEKKGSIELHNEFNIDKITKLCHIDAQIVLQNDKQWKKFFRMLVL